MKQFCGSHVDLSGGPRKFIISAKYPFFSPDFCIYIFIYLLEMYNMQLYIYLCVIYIMLDDLCVCVCVCYVCVWISKKFYLWFDKSNNLCVHAMREICCCRFDFQAINFPDYISMLCVCYVCICFFFGVGFFSVRVKWYS